MPRKEATRNTAPDTRSAAAYGVAEAARYVKLSPATLRSWTVGRVYPTSHGTRQFPPLLRLPSKRPPVLSFWNLVEAHVLRSLRTDHGVSVQALRDSLRYAERNSRLSGCFSARISAPTPAKCFSRATVS
jgi:hypothetical protein